MGLPGTEVVRFLSRSAGRRPSLRRVLLWALLSALPAAVPDAKAQDLEPRAYANTPVGMNFLVAGYAYTAGDVLTDPTLPIENAKVTAHATVLAYARSFELLGQSGKVDVMLPWVWVDGQATIDGTVHDRSVSGLSDPRIRVSWNFVGAPALTLEEYRGWHQDTILGVSLAIFAPLGQYDDDRLLNIGTNRWAFRPEIGMSKAVGKFVGELSAAVSFYTDNDDFFGGHERSQDPLFSLQGHLLYTFPYGIWASFDSTFYGGGRSATDGVPAREDLQNVRVGATLALPLGRHYSLKLYGSTGAYTSSGSDFDLVGVAIQFRWGGGL